ncbi:MAG: bifunctional phosphoribosylaminoimidazolecarboxamide formyltransferase/IMP cyclohydrolase [Peptococcaceae bacterium]|nr:bifunctional phosphoribosylaminoimidazolecarboxamide formyltransferase/IMP cyclohydrolase [Peptococcaceae bacterium]
MARRALLSVSDKTGIVDFAKGLAELGFELVSTGGTYKKLTDNGLDVLYISAVTEFPEILDGRVKTLHPRVHGGILAKDTQEHRNQCRDQGIDFIDLVCVNLYPFVETISQPDVSWAEAIENIDIGGPAMIRAAAKNHERVIVVVCPSNYDVVLESLKLEEGQTNQTNQTDQTNQTERLRTPDPSEGYQPHLGDVGADGNGGADMRKKLACEAFAHTAAYDAAVADYFRRSTETLEEYTYPHSMHVVADKIQMLRYGENPGQKAAVYADRKAGAGMLVRGKQLQGKELSYNNWADMDSSWALVNEFASCACAIIKHTNPCGLAVGENVFEAYERALACDPSSAYGGIIAFNRPIDGKTAAVVRERFYEVIVAPDFDQEAQGFLSEKKNLRLFAMNPGGNSMGNSMESASQWRGLGYSLKSIGGGFLVQDEDRGSSAQMQWRVVSALQPTQGDLEEMSFAWTACKHVKSNAIVVSNYRQILGVGAGQMNRVGAAAIALEQAGMRSRGAYLASDAFFPFADTAELAAQYAIRAIIQTGGSVHDADVIDTVDKLGLIMVFTNRRHFKH